MGMHYRDRRVVVPQQITALGKLLYLIAHALEQRAPCYAAGKRYTLDGSGQSPLVDGAAGQTFAQEVRGEQVFDT